MRHLKFVKQESGICITAALLRMDLVGVVGKSKIRKKAIAVLQMRVDDDNGYKEKWTD